MEIHTTAEDLVPRCFADNAHNSSYVIERVQGDIIEASAGNTPDMIVPVCVAVKPSLSMRHFQPGDDTACGKYFQVPIHRAERDLRETVFHPFIDLICRGMILYLSQFLKDQLSLFCHSHPCQAHTLPLSVVIRHTAAFCSIIVTITDKSAKVNPPQQIHFILQLIRV